MDFRAARQRARAWESMPGLRSRALIWDMAGREGGRSLMVLRPVPAPNSVMVRGVVLERSVNVWPRRGGRRLSSRAWRMLPSVS